MTYDVKVNTTLDTFESSTVSNVIDIVLLICDIIIVIVVAGKPLFSHIIKVGLLKMYSCILGKPSK